MRGETGRLTEEQRQLVADHWGWARGVAEHYRRRHPGIDRDWDGAVAEALCRLAIYYRPDRGARFSTFARRRLHGACLDVLRDESGHRTRRRRGLLEPVPLDGEAEPESGDLPVGWELESADAVERLARLFPPPVAHILRLLYLHAAMANQAAVARHLGLCPERVNQRIWDARARAAALAIREEAES